MSPVIFHAWTRRFRDWLQRPHPASRADTACVTANDRSVPEDAKQLYQTGVELLKAGRVSAALTSFDQAVALAPAFAEAHNHAGLALRALERFEEAAVRFGRAVAIRHDYVAAINNHGITCVDLKRYEEAEDSFKIALTFAPRSADTYFHLGMSCRSQKRMEEAISNFARAAELDPEFGDAHLILAELLAVRGRLEEALQCYRKAITLNPVVPELHLNCGLVLLKLHKPEEAAGCFKEALTLRADFAQAHFNLGNAHKEQEKYAAAIECYERVIALKPDHGGAYMNLGHIYKWQGDIDRSLDMYRRGLAIKPDDPHAHHNIGYALSYQNRIAEAIASFERVLELDPEYAETHLNLALTRLLAGDFARGWEAYEWRFRQRNPDNQVLKRKFPCREWNGEPLAGKRLLIWGEQGIGDEILFAGLYQEMIERAAPAQCLIECMGKLVPLFQRSFPGAETIAKTEPMHPAIGDDLDYHVAAGSLGRWLRTSRESFPDRRGYLVADPSRVAYWRQRLAGLGAGLKVGFSWRSSNLKGERALACTQLGQWEPLFRVPGVHFVSLQYGECRKELEEARERFGLALHAYDEIDLFNDLDAAAALTAAVDLVVSAPTSVSILAAALGVPTWQMSYGPDWQTHGTHRNLWYPAMTRFWRAWNKTWEEVLGAVAAKLAEESGRAAKPVDGRQR